MGQREVHKNVWFERVPLITWWQVHNNFLFHNVHHHHVMTDAQEFLFLKGTPSCDDRSTRIFGLRGSALITWWQIHKNFLFHNIHPHCVMTCAHEFFVPKRSTCHHVMKGPQEFLPWEGLPSLFTSSIVLRTEPNVFHCRQAHRSFGNHNMTWWSKYSLWEEVPLQKWWSKPMEASEARCC